MKAETFSDDEQDIIKLEPQSAAKIKPESEELPVTSFVPPEYAPNCYVKNEPEIEIIDDVRLQEEESVASSISADFKKSPRFSLRNPKAHLH